MHPLATGLALDVYTGCKDRLAYNMGRMYNITMKLARGYLLHNHLLYTDNFYSSLFLIREESEDEIRADRCTSPSGKMKQTASANQLTLIMWYPTLLPVRFPRSTPSRGNYILLLKITLFSTIPCANYETTDELSIVIHEYLYNFMEFIDTMNGECKRDAAKVIHEYLYIISWNSSTQWMVSVREMQQRLYMSIYISFHGIHRHNGW